MSRKRFGRQKRKHFKKYRTLKNTGWAYYFEDTYIFAQRHARKDYNSRPNSNVTYRVTWNAPSPSRMGVIYGEC